MQHPKRHMRDGTATTRRAHGVERVECDNPYHAVCFEAVTSWAGDPIPRRNKDWHVYLNREGVSCLLGPLVGRETPQFEAGLMRRAVNALRAEKG
jgi:hypothetical protein